MTLRQQDYPNDVALVAQLMLERSAAVARLRRTAPAWTAPRRHALLELARKEKCFSAVAMALDEAGLLDPADRQELQVSACRNQSGRDLARDLPAAAVLLKGAALERYYPPGVERDALDVDICLLDSGAILPLSQHLRGQGYEVGTTVLWRVDEPANGPQAGAIRFFPPERSADRVSAEIHFGGFATSLASGVTIAELRRMAHCDDGVATGALTLTPTGQLCIMLADFAIRTSTPITVRHVVDVVCLVRERGDDIDMAGVLEFVMRHSICNSIVMLGRKMEECAIAALPPVLAELVAHPVLRRAGRAQRSHYRRVLLAPPQDGVPVWKALARTVLFAYRRATLRAVTIPRLRPLLRWTEIPWLNLCLARCGMRMAMTPISRRPAPGYGRKQVGKALFYETPMGTFYMNQHGLVGQARKERLFAMLAGTPEGTAADTSRAAG